MLSLAIDAHVTSLQNIMVLNQTECLTYQALSSYHSNPAYSFTQSSRGLCSEPKSQAQLNGVKHDKKSVTKNNNQQEEAGSQRHALKCRRHEGATIRGEEKIALRALRQQCKGCNHCVEILQSIDASAAKTMRPQTTSALTARKASKVGKRASSAGWKRQHSQVLLKKADYSWLRAHEGRTPWECKLKLAGTRDGNQEGQEDASSGSAGMPSSVARARPSTSTGVRVRPSEHTDFGYGHGEVFPCRDASPGPKYLHVNSHSGMGGTSSYKPVINKEARFPSGLLFDSEVTAVREDTPGPETYALTLEERLAQELNLLLAQEATIHAQNAEKHANANSFINSSVETTNRNSVRPRTAENMLTQSTRTSIGTHVSSEDSAHSSRSKNSYECTHEHTIERVTLDKRCTQSSSRKDRNTYTHKNAHTNTHNSINMQKESNIGAKILQKYGGVSRNSQILHDFGIASSLMGGAPTSRYPLPHGQSFSASTRENSRKMWDAVYINPAQKIGHLGIGPSTALPGMDTVGRRSVPSALVTLPRPATAGNLYRGKERVRNTRKGF